MVTRANILILGITAGVTGGLFGGLLLALAMVMITGGANAGWALLFVAAPAAALPGWLLARQLARGLR